MLNLLAFADQTALVPLTPSEIKSIHKIFSKNRALQTDLLPVIREFGIEDRVATRSCSWFWSGLNQLLGSPSTSLSSLIPGLNLLQQDFFRTCVLESLPESHFILKSLNPKLEDGQLQIAEPPQEFSAITNHVMIKPAEIRSGLAGTRLPMAMAISVTHFHYSDSGYTHSYEYEFSVELRDGRIFDFKGKRIQAFAKADFIKVLRNVVENVALLQNPSMLESETLRLGQALKLIASKHPKLASEFEVLYQTLDPIYYNKRKNSGTDNFMRVILLETEVEEDTSLDRGLEKSIDNLSLQESDVQLRSIYLNDENHPSDNPTPDQVFRCVLSEWDGRLHYNDEIDAANKYIRDVVSKNPDFYRAVTLRRGGEPSIVSGGSGSGSNGSGGIGLGEIIIFTAILNNLSHSSNGSGQ